MRDLTGIHLYEIQTGERAAIPSYLKNSVIAEQCNSRSVDQIIFFTEKVAWKSLVGAVKRPGARTASA